MGSHCSAILSMSRDLKMYPLTKFINNDYSKNINNDYRKNCYKLSLKRNFYRRYPFFLFSLYPFLVVTGDPDYTTDLHETITPIGIMP